MARLYEYQGKSLIRLSGIDIPRGIIADTPEKAGEAAQEIDCPVVVKAQTWTTSRASSGGIEYAQTPEETVEKARNLLGKQFGEFRVKEILVEEKLDIREEFYGGIIIDDHISAPVVVFNRKGGTGIENRSESLVLEIDIQKGLYAFQMCNLLRTVGIHGQTQTKLADLMVKLYQTARTYEARSAEINPIALTSDDELIAVDCRISIDDYAVFRHPELEIEMARELSHPPTALDKVAHQVEYNDYRGTFYFIQLEEKFQRGERVIGFHGAGGGGSMMSMDGLLDEGFRIANFCDTSGNPPASKVYRAARIILSQKNLDGYFGSGSGVASQEQIHSARGLVKAFREVNLNIPAVIRLGGNMEDEAVRILTEYTKDLAAPVEGYKRDDPVSFCINRLKELITGFDLYEKKLSLEMRWTAPKEPYQFQTVTNGTVTFDHALCRQCTSKVCIQKCIPQILAEESDVPVLKITEQEAMSGKCTECLACELECEHIGMHSARIELPIPGLEEI